MTFYWCSTVIWLYPVSFLRYSLSKNVVTLKLGLKVTQCHWKWYHSIDSLWFPMSLKRTVLRYSTSKYTVTLKPGLGSLKVIEDDTIQSGIHDFFLLTFHSNHRPISHRFRDKRRFPSKIARKSPIFPPLCIYHPTEGFPLELGIGAGVRRN